MKMIALIWIIMMSLAVTQNVDACVGRILTIGISNSVNEQLLAEIVSQLVSERTGSNVKIVHFNSPQEMYSAVKKGEVSLVIENLDRGSLMVARAQEKPSRAIFDAVKKEYRKNYNLIWFEPFGESQFYAPVVAIDVLEILPALPKLVGKLAGVLTEDTYAKLLKTAKNNGKAREVAKDFLKSRCLI
ncbi:MAG: hypothetical protein GJV46_10335 [Geobacter sp.]|nr:hypothetical protein [Geobacter sp.]